MATNCPACSAAVLDTATECASCGIIFEKWRARQTRPVTPPSVTPLSKPTRFLDKGPLEKILYGVGVLAGLYFIYVIIAMMYLRFQRDPVDQLGDRVNQERAEKNVTATFDNIRGNLQKQQASAAQTAALNAMTMEQARAMLDKLKLENNLPSDQAALEKFAGNGDLLGVTAAIKLGVPVPATALHAACWSPKSADLAGLLLSGGAPVNEQINGQTALIAAASKSNGAVMRKLIAAGADVNVRNNSGQSAMTLAAFWGCADCAQQLVEAHAEVNFYDNDNKTPLMWAKEQNRYPVVQILIRAGANQ